MPAVRQDFLTSRQGVLRSRCRHSKPLPSGFMGRASDPWHSGAQAAGAWPIERAIGAASSPPVVQDERIAEQLDSLVVGGVARDQLQTMPQGNGGDDCISPPDGLARALQVGVDAAGLLGTVDVESEDLLGG